MTPDFGATPPESVAEDVRRALAEDVGGGDVTASLLPESLLGRARIISREAAVLCGGPWLEQVYAQLDPRVGVRWQARDGEALAPDQLLCELRGPARALLTGERTALNFVQCLSGTATAARRYAEAVAGTGTKILDTRKTLPGLRAAQKYAVRCGGCHNHRLGLYDAILIKENHIFAAGSIAAAVGAAHARHPGLSVEVEVEDLAELEQALSAGADVVMLDNFSLADVGEAVRRTARRARLEVSGGLELDRIRALAEAGVDYISVGALTKHVRAVDLSMRFEAGPAGS